MTAPGEVQTLQQELAELRAAPVSTATATVSTVESAAQTRSSLSFKEDGSALKWRGDGFFLNMVTRRKSHVLGTFCDHGRLEIDAVSTGDDFQMFGVMMKMMRNWKTTYFWISTLWLAEHVIRLLVGRCWGKNGKLGCKFGRYGPITTLSFNADDGYAGYASILWVETFRVPGMHCYSGRWYYWQRLEN